MQTRTFLFADLREYTKFVEHHGDAAAAMLIGDYRRLVRAEVARAEGAEVKTEGDSFYVVFSSAAAALRCGTAILREAERYSRERPDRPMRVGVGIHAGEPQPHEGQFVGEAVILAARLAQRSGPGELLISDVVRGLLPRGAGPAMTEREGLELKGIDNPPRVFGVSWEAVDRSVRTAAAEVSVPARPPEGIVAARELIGRETELAALEAFLSDASLGNGRLVLVAGEAGLGKSALLRHFLGTGSAQAASTLIGECTEIETRRPFGPIADAFVAGGMLLPRAFRATGPGAQAEIEADRYVVHSAFAQALRDRAGSTTVMLILEDVHWADPATLELLEYLPRQIRRSRMLVLATYRSDELHRRHPLNDTLAELERQRLSSEVRLRALDEDETARLISSALGLERAPTTEFRRAIYERCGGNPFFTEEVLRALVGRGDLKYADGAWRRARAVSQIDLPRTISAAVDQRLRQLPHGALHIIRLAAVIGTRFDFELLAQVSQAPEIEVINALREAVDAQLVIEELGDGDENYRFRHALTREAILSELLGRERRVHHRAVAEALEARAGGDTGRYVEELAYHFDAAHEIEKTIRYRAAAAERATRAGSYALAISHLDRCIELAPPDQPELGRLYLALSRAAVQARDLVRSAEAATTAAAVAEERADPLLLGDALAMSARIETNMGVVTRARELADRAIAVLEPSGATVELARAHAVRAWIAVLTAEPAQEQLAERAVRAAEVVDDLESRISAMNYLGLSRGAAGVLALRQGLDLAVEHGFHERADVTLNHLAQVSFDGGATGPEVRGLHAERIAHAQRFGLRSDQLLVIEVLAAIESGEWELALRIIEEGRGGSLFSAVRDLQEAYILAAREGPERAIPRIDGPRDRLLANGAPQYVRHATTGAQIRWLVGDHAGALEDARPLFDNPPDWPAENMLIAAVLAAESLGDDVARRAFIERTYATRVHAARRPQIAIAFAQGIEAEAANDRAAALAEYERCAAMAAEWLLWFALTQARIRRARLLVASGLVEDAKAEFEIFLPYWRKAKATWYLGELEKKAQAMGIELVTA